MASHEPQQQKKSGFISTVSSKRFYTPFSRRPPPPPGAYLSRSLDPISSRRRIGWNVVTSMFGCRKPATTVMNLMPGHAERYRRDRQSYLCSAVLGIVNSWAMTPLRF